MVHACRARGSTPPARTRLLHTCYQASTEIDVVWLVGISSFHPVFRLLHASSVSRTSLILGRRAGSLSVIRAMSVAREKPSGRWERRSGANTKSRAIGLVAGSTPERR